MTRYYNGDIATQAGISKDNFSHWLNNSNLPKTDKALGQWEAKLREWSTAAREKLAQGRTDELPKARAVAAVDAGGGRGRGGRGGKGGVGAGAGAAAARRRRRRRRRRTTVRTTTTTRMSRRATATTGSKRC